MQKIIQNSSDLLTLVDVIQQVAAKFQEKINGTELESNYDVKYALERIDDEFSNIKRGIWAVLGAASKYQRPHPNPPLEGGLIFNRLMDEMLTLIGANDTNSNTNKISPLEGEAEGVQL